MHFVISDASMWVPPLNKHYTIALWAHIQWWTWIHNGTLFNFYSGRHKHCTPRCLTVHAPDKFTPPSHISSHPHPTHPHTLPHLCCSEGLRMMILSVSYVFFLSCWLIIPSTGLQLNSFATLCITSVTAMFCRGQSTPHRNDTRQ